MTGSLCPVESGVLAVLIRNPHPFNVGCVVRVVQQYDGALPDGFAGSVRLWVVQFTTPSIGYAADETGSLVEVTGDMWGMAMVREEDLLVLRTGEDSGPIRFCGEPRDTAAHLVELRHRIETLH